MLFIKLLGLEAEVGVSRTIVIFAYLSSKPELEGGIMDDEWYLGMWVRLCSTG